jgi:hypothetical protein
MKKLYSDLLGKPSLVTLLSGLTDIRQEAHRNSAIALDKILNQILNFRGKHIAVAKSAYSLQSRLKVIWMKGASKVFGIGSAGYGLDTLDMILDLTKDAKTRLITAFPETEQ